MPKVIVGIHGLANKPKKDTLADWWKKSIKEGLNKNCQIAESEFQFEMVYWADLLYKNQQHGDKLFAFDALYNDQPYTKAGPSSLERHEDDILDTVMAGALGVVGATVDMLKERFEMNKLADWVLGKVVKDLAFYYDKDRKIGDGSTPPQLEQARKVLQKKLWDALDRLKGNEIMLIAHSMGTIIAYDVLRDIGQEDPGFEIAHFVTIGSPLGLPHVKGKIIEERDYDGQGRERVRTPSVVSERWVNYADRKDPVALDVHLRDDYRQNKKGIRVEDDLVINGYLSPSDEPNHHKSYGYLRTPELSEHIRDFLT
ncbi:MAG: alpha/beta hydrolase [Alphaproteobacteria bacterium]|nr:alpha/beta hydrolase [Alphaproteobacteria bacterium]